MNREQAMRMLQSATVAGGPVALLVAMFATDSVQADKIVAAIGAVVTLIGLVWTWYEAKESRQVEKTGEIQGVQVHVNADPTAKGAFPVASPEVVAVAKSPNPDVGPMTGGPVVN